MVTVAREAYAVALTGAPATAREIAFVYALGDWLDGRPSAATARLQIVLNANPRDALVMKLLQGIHFIMARPTEMRQLIGDVLGT